MPLPRDPIPNEVSFTADPAATQGYVNGQILGGRGGADVVYFGAIGDGATDCSTIINALFATYRHVVIPAGTFVAANLTPSAGRSIVGMPGAVLKLKAGSTKLIDIAVSDVTVRDLVLDGGNVGPWAVSGASFGTRSGIYINNDAGLERITIDNVEIKGFDLGGITGVKTVVGFNFGHRLTLNKVNAHHNYVGIGLNPYCEYTIATACYCYKNYIGVYTPAGNNKFVACAFEENFWNCSIEGGYNNTHGGFFGCSFNHAATGQSGALGLRASGVENGMVFLGCFFWYGAISLTNCTGVYISHGQLGLDPAITASGGGLNKITDNYTTGTPSLTIATTARVQFRHNQSDATGTQDVFAKYGDFYVVAEGSSWANETVFNAPADVIFPFANPEKRLYGVTNSAIESGDVVTAYVTGYYNINASFGFTANTGAGDQLVTFKLVTYLNDGTTVKKTYDVSMMLKAAQAGATLKIAERVYLAYGESFKFTFSNSDAAGVKVLNAQTYYRAIKEV